MIWRCPKCGPVGDPFHGEDEQFHCPKIDCEEVVEFTEPLVHPQNLPWSITNSRLYIPTPTVDEENPMPKEKP